ncbi:MAG: NACHT domain-containing protein [Bacteroidota bacterium]
MNSKIKEKITDIILDVELVFTTKVMKNALNNARQIAEAICKALIYNKFGVVEGENIVLGIKNNKGIIKLTKGGTPKPQKPDLNELIAIVLESDILYQVITDFHQREKAGLYLQSIRTHGNSASHNANTSKDKPKKEDLPLIRANITSLINWFFIHLEEPVHHQIKPFLENLENKTTSKELSPLQEFEKELCDWIQALGYDFGEVRVCEDNKIIFSIKVPDRRKTIDVLVIGLISKIEMPIYEESKNLKIHYDCDEAWVVTTSSVSKSVIQAINTNKKDNILCYNLDAFIEENIDLTKYFDWVKNEIIQKGIDKKYVQIGCQKSEYDEKTKDLKAISKYEEEDGFTEGYLNQWLSLPEREHVSVLGDFGTGKTWLALHFAWELIKEYEEKKLKNLPRPRIPILIYLRDFAKAVNVESLISDFFFRKHQIEIKGVFKAFTQLNKMGKILLIFDGFDEMADKVDKQKMVNNFWELASVIQPKSKVILTCRSEHFPQIKEGRALLNSELRETTKKLSGDKHQFGILELLKLNEKQIKKILLTLTSPENTKKLINNKEIKDLLGRPIMTNLIIDAISEIEAGKPINMARIYFYATTRKMERDIEQNRTFTSLADKLYFMCELSWFMLSQNKLRVHYKDFGQFTEKLFGCKVENNELDYWRYDMRGQTMLVIDEEDGYYKPAHKSFLEFFIVYKFVGELGILPKDFLLVAQKQSFINSKSLPREYTWSEYFTRQKNSQGEIQSINLLSEFKTEKLTSLVGNFGKEPLTRVLLDLLSGIVELNDKNKETLWSIIGLCKGKAFDDVRYLVTNIILLIADREPHYFEKKDLSKLCMRNLKFPKRLRSDGERGSYDSFSDSKGISFYKSNLAYSDLSGSDLGNIGYKSDVFKSNILGSKLQYSDLTEFKFQHRQLNECAYNSTLNVFALGSPDELVLINATNFEVVKRKNITAWHLIFSPDNKTIITSGWGVFNIIRITDFKLLKCIKLSKQFNSKTSESDNLWTGNFVFSNKNPNILYIGCVNSFTYVYDLNQDKEIAVFKNNFQGGDLSLSVSESHLIKYGFHELILWDLSTQKKITLIQKNKKHLDYFYALFHPFINNLFVYTDKSNIVFYDISEGRENQIECKNADEFCFSRKGKLIAVNAKNKIIIVDVELKKIIEEVDLSSIKIDKPIKNEKGFSRFQIQQLIFDKADFLIICEQGGYIHKIDWKEKKCLETYSHYADHSGTSFKHAKGVGTELKKLLVKNGAIF